jgi:hypothetical protein
VATYLFMNPAKLASMQSALYQEKASQYSLIDAFGDSPAELEERRLAEMQYCQQLERLRKGKQPAKEEKGQRKVRCYKLLLPEEENVLLEIIKEVKDVKIRCAAIEAKNKQLAKQMVEAQDGAYAEIDKRQNRFQQLLEHQENRHMRVLTEAGDVWSGQFAKIEDMWAELELLKQQEEPIQKEQLWQFCSQMV